VSYSVVFVDHSLLFIFAITGFSQSTTQSELEFVLDIAAERGEFNSLVHKRGHRLSPEDLSDLNRSLSNIKTGKLKDNERSSLFFTDKSDTPSSTRSSLAIANQNPHKVWGKPINSATEGNMDLFDQSVKEKNDPTPAAANTRGVLSVLPTDSKSVGGPLAPISTDFSPLRTRLSLTQRDSEAPSLPPPEPTMAVCAAVTRRRAHASTGPTALTLLHRGFKLVANDVSVYNFTL
jgi:hypothetical protein